MVVIIEILRKHLPNLIKLRMIRILIWIFVVIAYGVIGFHLIENQTWTVSLYWTFVTIGTVGYGDYSPKTPLGMYFAISLIVLGIGSFAIAVGEILEFLFEKQQMKLMGLIKVKKSQHVVICGWTESTAECIREIGKDNAVFVVDENEEVKKKALKNGASFVHGDPTRVKDLEKANVVGAKAIIVDMESDSQTIHCILSIRKLDQDVRIIAEVQRYENIEQIQLAGANQVISPFVISGRLMQKSIDDGYEAMFVQEVLAEHKNREMKEVEVAEKSYFNGKTVREADIHEKTGVVLVGVGKKGDLTIDPPRDYIIHAGDVILGIGKPEEFEKLKNQ
ncbi:MULTISPECIES: potassium channel family protein [Methanobacterium]|uniref:Calcium-gated potassium channel mthK n=1 Tax=Methanobacterium bryantii TaxID=2161 RepID=A0A2A2H6F0_METBR|nr:MULTISPECIES: potassium channel protein [Methanobacterium]OEC84594.1 calcium-gated potassium channel mthK [Methanobacterium sp. A39]PAV04896.1 calcium-gated potassium channel mthK [Methanobacterium bryantii]